MKDILIGTALFGSGAAIGVLTTRKYFEKKYKQIADEEIESVKEAFGKKEPINTTLTEDEFNILNKKTEEKPLREKTSIDDFKNVISTHNYSNSNNIETGYVELHEIINENSINDDPYIIPPDEFGTIDDYDNISLIYYADHVLADEGDCIIENIEDTVGSIALTSFGEYEDDSVFVRNDRLKTDFEILLDNRTWSEVTGR